MTESANPLKWKSAHRMALAVSIVAGGAAGNIVGYYHFGRSNMSDWFEYRTGEAFVWAVTGAIIVGAAIYVRRVFSD